MFDITSTIQFIIKRNCELGNTHLTKDSRSMSTLEVSPVEPVSGQSNHSVTNDFSIQVATVNGSGSQTANSVLMRSIFQMGIPVSGKNMFPSNIAGLPTWFTIRASKHGYIGRRKGDRFPDRHEFRDQRGKTS